MLPVIKKFCTKAQVANILPHKSAGRPAAAGSLDPEKPQFPITMASVSDFDAFIAQLLDCKHLSEHDVNALCSKVRVLFVLYASSICVPDSY